jgi:CHAT domain-containing protein
MKFIYLLLILAFVALDLQAQTAADTVYFEQLHKEVEGLYALRRVEAVGPILKKGLQVAKEKGNDYYYGTFLDNLAQWHKRVQNYEESEKLNAELLAFWAEKRGKRDILYAFALNNKAQLYEELGKLEGLDSLYVEILQIYADTLGQDNIHYATTLNNYAIYNENIGKNEAAEELYLQMVEILKTVDTSNTYYPNALGNFGTFFEMVGKFKESEFYILECINLNEQKLGKNYADKSTDLNNLATLYMNTRRYEEAERLFLQVLVLDGAVSKNTPEYSGVLTNLTSLYTNLRNYDKAEQYLSEALEINKNIYGDKHFKYAGTLLKYNIIYLTKGKIAEAKVNTRKALDIYTATYGAQHYSTSSALRGLADCFLAEQKLDSARYYILAAITANLLDDEKIPEFALTNLSSLGSLDYQSGSSANTAFGDFANILRAEYKLNPTAENLEALNQLSRAALEYNERRRRNTTQEDNQLALLRNNNKFIHTAVAANLSANTEEGRAAAFAFLEQSKSILLASTLQSRQNKNISKLPDSLLAREANIIEQIAQLQNEYLQTSEKAAKNNLRTEILSLNRTLEQLRQTIKIEDPNYYQLKYEHRATSLSQVREMLPEDALLLEYLVTDSAVYVFAIDQKNIRTYTIAIQADSFAQKMNSLRNSLSNFDYIIADPAAARFDFSSNAYYCYASFVEPMLKDAPNAKHLIIVADQQFTHLPFEALLTAPAPDNAKYQDLDYLIRTYQISYAYSATMLQQNQRATQSNRQSKNIFAIAADYSLPINNLDPEARIAKKYSLRRSLQPLPAAKQEVEKIAEIFHTTPNFGDQASEAFFKEHAHQYGIIHLAMHGIVDSKYPALSALAFSEIGDKGEDNFLQAHEIAKLPLQAQLVVLSACETGYGKYEQGEGVMSLGRAFMYAGVPTLVSTLWSVNDVATAILMENFYQQLLQGDTPAKALQTAKLQYLATAKGQSAHPAFWAAFVQIGDNQPISAAQKSNVILCTIIALAAIGILSAIYFISRRKKAK